LFISTPNAEASVRESALSRKFSLVNSPTACLSSVYIQVSADCLTVTPVTVGRQVITLSSCGRWHLLRQPATASSYMIYYTSPRYGCQVIVIIMSVRSHNNSKTSRPNFTISRVLPVVVARSSSDSAAILSLFTVLRMMCCTCCVCVFYFLTVMY